MARYTSTVDGPDREPLRQRIAKGSGDTGLSLRSDDLSSVGEPYAENYFRQQVMTIEAPAFLGALGQLENHRERGLVREAPFGAHRSVAHPFMRLTQRTSLELINRQLLRECL